MLVCEILLISLLILTGVRASFTDIRHGVVKNRDLLLAVIIGIVIDIVYYGVFARDIITDFLLNLLLVFLVLLFLYKTNSFAGGDLKLGIVMTILYPARLYLVYRHSIYTLIFALGFAFAYGYIWLVGDSVIGFFRKGSIRKTAYVKNYLLRFIVMYFTASMYVMLVSMLLTIFSGGQIPEWLLWLVCLCVAWLVRKEKLLRIWFILVPVIICVIIVAVVWRILPFSISPGTYVFTGALILCQMFISTNLYKGIKTKDVEAGMILSTASTVMMGNSRIKGMPGISSESLKDRLSEEEAECVRKWEKSEKGKDSVAIVKKIPFALFIAVGFFTYLIVWVILNEI